MFIKFFLKNKSIVLLISASLIIIFGNFFRFYQNNTAYQFDPWLSNYQGGFVRRGMPGEFFFQFYQIFEFNPALLALFFVFLLYFFLYFFFFKLLAAIKLNRLLIISLFSPLGFFFPILNSKASGHKEVIFLFFLSLFCYFVSKIKDKNKSLLLMIFIIIFSGLSYEITLLYIPYLVIPFIYFTNFTRLRELFLYLLVIGLTTLILIFLNYVYRGNEQQVIDICNSIILFVNPECVNVGKIADLRLSISEHTTQKGNWNYGLESLYLSYFKIYFIGFVIGFFPLIALFLNSRFSQQKISFLNLHPIIILFLPLFFLIPIFYMGADWGRYLYISYISTLIVLMFLLKNNILVQIKNIQFFDSINKFIFVSIIFIYCFGWTVPICCEKNFKPGIIEVLRKIALFI